MKKRLMSLGLCILLVCSILPLSAGATNLPFKDIPSDYFAYDAIEYVYENGIMNGMSDTAFGPDSYFTRAMFVTILGRMHGVNPNAYPGSSFSDVSTRDQSIAWAAPYINWASQNGIVNGVGGGKFSPNTIITREQYCTIILRYFNATNAGCSAEPPRSVFLSDGYDISAYATAGVRTMVGYGLIDLYPDRSFIPKHLMNRVEIAETFSLVHQFVKTGYYPGYDDSRYYPDQGNINIHNAILDTVQFTWDWFIDCSFTDNSQIVKSDFNTNLGYTLYNHPHEKVIAPGVCNLYDLTTLGRDYYAPKALESLMAEKNFIEKNGHLYISKADGLGGFSTDRCNVDIKRTGDTQFTITFHMYAGNQSKGTESVKYSYNGSRWVFSDPLPIDLLYADISYG